MDGRSKSLRGRLTCHCLLVETRDELVLIDTGYGVNDVRDPRSRLSRVFLALLRPELREELTAVRQVRALGFDPRDVRHIVLTHLDFDHAGGLDDFPHATVHMLSAERDAALAQKTVLDRMRYRPQQWRDHEEWLVYPTCGGGEDFYDFACVRELQGVPPEIVLVPLVGHTFGHAGVAVKRERDWVLLAGDAYFYHREMAARPYCTPGLRVYQTMMQKDRRMRLANQRRLRELVAAHGNEVRVVCSHDVTEFERVAGRPHAAPATRQIEPLPIFGIPAEA
jgi:glyoxylase-like metal-dependent hydrolase (beta-lactamase superfamily II)